MMLRRLTMWCPIFALQVQTERSEREIVNIESGITITLQSEGFLPYNVVISLP